MDYQKARQTRKSGLLSLIGEKRYEEGQSVKGAIGGAISDKFKAQVAGIKEQLDPMNWIRKLTGKGALGDIAVSQYGRMRGRSDKDIQAFGGYKRKKKAGDDPQITTVSAGPIKPLETGDSTSDILGKIYNFMLKSDEVHKLNDQIKKAFRQEQFDEDGRRHDKLVKAIKEYIKKNKKSETEGKDEKESDSNIKGLFGAVSALVAGIAIIGSALSAFAVGILATPGAESFRKGLQDNSMLGAASGDTALAAGILDANQGEAPGVVRARQEKLKEALKDAPMMTRVYGVDQDKYLKEKGYSDQEIKDMTMGLGDKAKLSAKEEESRNQKLIASFEKKGSDVTKATEDELKAVYQQQVDYGALGAQSRVKKDPKTADKDDVVKATLINKVESELQKRSDSPAASSPATAVPAAASAASSPAPQAIPKSANADIPTQVNPEQSLGKGETVIPIVNNTVNTVGGKPPKLIQTSTAKPRNSDLNRYLRDISVVV